MADRQTSRYGTWESPITPALTTDAATAVAELRLDGDDIYWLESRPAEGGRMAVVQRHPDGTRTERTPEGFNARTRVHEYGGASYSVHQGIVMASNFSDNRLYRLAPHQEPEALTEDSAQRYADPVVDAKRRRLIAICEDHTVDRPSEVVNSLVAIDLDGKTAPRRLAGGCDFYAAPRLSPDGRKLAWISWNHPNMPWDETELWTADIAADGALIAARRIAGGAGESLLEPNWSSDGQLVFISDRSGWWNLYRWNNGDAEPLLPLAAEFSGPQWSLALSHYGFLDDRRLVAAYQQDGQASLAVIDLRTKETRRVDTPYSSIASLKAASGAAVLVAGSPQEAWAVVRWQASSGQFAVLKETMQIDIDRAYFSVPEAIEFETTGRAHAHAFFYPPTNPRYEAPAEEKPPLIAISHGGPTGASAAVLSLAIQFWTSRGFAVVDVNYGGSVGYGRAYRRRLLGQWGVVDIDDVVAAARHLAERGSVDRNRMAIRGRSAGGYTTLAALTFRQVFTAGASYFGVSDIETLAQETHKFESRYMDSLVGPYPKRRDLYVERSPIHFADRLTAPVIFFQGLDDKIVLPNQAERMVKQMEANGVPVAYLPFAGEGHGFRRADSLIRAHCAELYFYGQVFGFTPADQLEEVEIRNRARLGPERT